MDARILKGLLTAAVLRVAFHGRVRGTNYTLGLPFHLRAQKGGTISFGRGVRFMSNARIIARRGHLVIGDDASFGKNVTLVAFADLTIGARTLIGQNVSIHTENHGPPGDRNAFEKRRVTIGADVWIGAGAVVTAGRTIGDRVTVGANSVVTRDLLLPGTYGGVPAVLIRPLDD